MAEPRLDFGCRAFLASGLAVLLAGSAAPALAQGQGPARPFRALFGSGTDVNARHRVDTRLGLAAAYDSDLDESEAAGVPGVDSIGHSTRLDTGVDYQWTTRRVVMQARGTSALRHQAVLDEIHSVGHSGTLSVLFQLPARTVFTLSQTATHTPSVLSALFPQLRSAQAEPPTLASPDQEVKGSSSTSYATSATLGYNVLGRTSVLAAADLQRTDGSAAGGAVQRLEVSGLLGQFQQRIRRNVVVQSRYRYRVGDVGQTPGQTMTEHGAELALDYRRALSATRAMTLGGGVGGAALVLPSTTAGATPVRREPYRVTGNLSAGYQFTRTWETRAVYRRGIDWLAALREPVSTDGMTATVEGGLVGRLELAAAASYSSGDSTWTPSSTRFDMYSGNVRLQYAASRIVTGYVEYVYYYYDFGEGALVLPGMLPRLQRQGARAGLSLNVPFVRSR